MAKYDKEGREIPDPKPVEVPLDFRRPPDIHELIARYVRSEAFKARAEAQGMETEEEANDFDVGGDEADDELAMAERAFIMSEEFPRDRSEVEAAAKAVQEARIAKRQGGGARGGAGPAPGKSVEAPEEK